MRLTAERLVRKHQGMPFIIMGTAWSLNKIPLKKIAKLQKEKKLVTIGCNRILRKYKPTYYCVADREPYLLELPLIRRYRGVRLLADTIYKKRIKHPRGVEAPPVPQFSWVAWRPTIEGMLGDLKSQKRAMKGDINVVQTDPTKEIISGANIAYCMFQLAILMGAQRIGFVGIDMTWESEAHSHFFGDGKKEGCMPFPGKCVAFHAAASNWIRHNKEWPIQEVRNLSPLPGPLDDIWGKEKCLAWLKRLTN